MEEDRVTLRYANYGACVILGDFITLCLTMFHDFVTTLGYTHLSSFVILSLILERTPGLVSQRVEIAIYRSHTI